MQDKKIDYFGFLPRKWSFAFDNVKILPFNCYKVIKGKLENVKNRDGFLYPPVSYKRSLNIKTNKLGEKVPNTKRPALLYKTYISHSLIIDSSTTIEDDRTGQAAFIIHLLGFLCGTRLQFHDWWIDMRIKIKEDAGIWCMNEKTAEHFLKHSFDIWKGWNERNQKLIINILYMFSRSVSYEWHWEQFMIDYMVFDGLFKICKNQDNKIKNIGHGERIKFLCNKFNIEYKAEIIDKIVKLRNELFHETLWGNEQPGSGNANFYRYVFCLHKLNECLIPAILGYNNNYGKRNWFSMTSCPFEMTK